MIQSAIQRNGTIDAAITRFAETGECDQRLVFLNEPNGDIAEQYRRIANNIVSRHPEGGTLMVTSPAPEDGKTLSAINFACCLAERGPTLLVDMDTRHSSVHRMLGFDVPLVGVEDALMETASPEDCVQLIPGTRLCVASNRGPGHAMVDLMGAGRPKRFLEWALQRFLWVILDTPPVFPIADTLEIAQHASVGMLVVRSRKTPARLVKQAMDALKGRLHFVLLNDGEAPSYSLYGKSYYFDRGFARRGEK
jgi:Mrp family chromosome partitioning ATPase